MFNAYIGAVLVIALLLFLVDAHQILPYVLLTGEYRDYTGAIGYSAIGVLGAIAAVAQYIHQRKNHGE